jgi:hypothetical protein
MEILMSTSTPGSDEQAIMQFLHERVFDAILNSPNASSPLKAGVRLTIHRMNERDAAGMVNYYWAAIAGTERSLDFADEMKRQGFKRFEDQDVIEEFQKRFPKYHYKTGKKR